MAINEIAVLDDSAVHLLDLGVGTFKHLADSREEIPDRTDGPNAASNWLLMPLVDRCVEAFTADLWRETKDLPDGTRVRLVVKG